MSSTAIPKVVPAQLSFLAIYNPALSDSDETFRDQIVFYYSKAAKARAKINAKDTQAVRNLREEENEKLRQVGLAQGMVGFARSFSSGEAVDSVETDKSRIILRELEEGWWVLASVDLTQLPATGTTTKTGSERAASAVEYSSREISPPALLLHQLNRAYAIFLLHHGSSLRSLFRKLDRLKFCNILDNYWSRFAANWDVLLHGSPAVDIYGGIKLAAGGELGMGVGEEEWGSGEREVLEDYARRTDGLVDLMVSRFAEPSTSQHPKEPTNAKEPEESPQLAPWIGSGGSVNSVDGVVFSGVGALSRRSLRDLSHWIETIYCYGDHAYGVRDNPTADRRKRRKRNPKSALSGDASSEPAKTQPPSKAGGSARSQDSLPPPGIPPPIVKAVESSLDRASSAVDSSKKTDSDPNKKPETFMASLTDTETWMKYVTLGYGTAWGGRESPMNDQPPTEDNNGDLAPEVSMRYVEPTPNVDHPEAKRKAQIERENSGYFIIGLKGEMEDGGVDDENDEGSWNNRIPLRTVHVELADETRADVKEETPSFDREISLASTATRKLSRLRPVVYVHRPFIYTFLFTQRTESLSLAAFYRNLHTYFSPLHRPLSNSTSPDRVAARIAAASNPYTTVSSTTGSEPNPQPIYDLVYDPRTMTVHSSIPNIPDPGTLIAEGLSSTAIFAGWSRVEALNVHSQILATVSDTRRTLSEIEKTCKTSRGWWVVWMRLPPSEVKRSTNPDDLTEEFDTAALREAFLIRRSRDSTVPSAKSSGARLGSGMWMFGPSSGQKMGGAVAGWAPKGLSEGIGIDARKYVEGLLSLNR
ncbi:hypothetical protein BDV95DRAFT_606200 [Massariosphaeria phaeospora]|uniref:CCZ1/INTU/HSP4 first Longin domain-containing protein n=1 Tax=Massariosphaeria phaeospora TaxID=100035 RepID=A0A7C8IGV4_9PLEO|nr:hypothetical protein BDV95DRAFT_606200 [Massariosphaeria phaeospora]